MKIDKSEIILSTRPSIKALGFGSFGFLFMGTFAYIMINAEDVTVAEGTNPCIAEVIYWATFSIFVFFLLASISMILFSKQFTLTQNYLILKRPFLFIKRTILLSAIKNIKEGDYEINNSRKGEKYNVYKGKKVVILLDNGKKIKINSFEINDNDYYLLINNLKRIRNNKKIIETTCNSKYDGYGWIIFMIICTIGLMYATFFAK